MENVSGLIDESYRDAKAIRTGIRKANYHWKDGPKTIARVVNKIAS